MCGIGGIIGKRSSSIAKKMIQKLHHRGPDYQNFWLSDPNEYPITICHTRLSIFDLSDSANQPFLSDDNRYVLSYNGEIYNFVELRKELEKKGINFRTNTDTEILLKGLLEEGTEFLLKCNGMWAFCLWDRKLEKAILGRDRFGVKPLFYSMINSKNFIFGSEMKSITPFLDHLIPSKDIDEMTKRIFTYEQTEECVIDGIKRVEAGYYLIYENNKITKKRYWNTLDHIKLNNLSYSEQLESWKYLFLDSVKIRMRADVPIGYTLSGGLDSSSIVAAAAHISQKNNDERISNDNINLFNSSFPNSFNDESQYAKKLADNLSVPLNKIIFNPQSQYSDLELAIAQVEDPYLTLPIPMLDTYDCISRKGIKVTLDGHGADELLLGYDSIKKAISSSSSFKQIKELIKIHESTVNGVYSEKAKKIKRKYLKYKFEEILKNIFYKNYYQLNKKNPKLFSKFRISPINFSEGIKDHPIYEEMDFFNQTLFELFHFTVLPTLLRNYDRYSMANGVETRMPFMDWRLVCETFSLPLESKIGKGFSKLILRDALKGILIDEIRQRKDKIGWNAPIHDWFRSCLKNNVQNTLSKNSQSIFYPSSKKALQKFEKNNNPNFMDGQKLWQSILPLVWESSLNNKLWR